MYPKIFIGPMSKNIVDSIILNSNEKNPIGLIASRRQIDYNSGYVNNWNTKEFCEYVKNKNKIVMVCRDHAGPEQGEFIDDGLESFMEDINYYDLVHIDVWKKHKNLEDGTNATIKFLLNGYKKNKHVEYEIGTEESIRYFTSDDLKYLLSKCKDELPEEVFNKIKFAVIQSGTSLLYRNNTGTYDSNRLTQMINVVKSFGLMSKEHNGDFQSDNIIVEKFNLGLDAINIAPEYGQFETELILKLLNDEQIEEFFKICYNSNKWQKWVGSDFVPINNKKELILISGHYVFSNNDFLNIKSVLDKNIDNFIIDEISNKIKKLISCL